MPLVLPIKDEPQFFRLLTKKARKSEVNLEFPSTSVGDDGVPKLIKVEPATKATDSGSTNLYVFIYLWFNISKDLE